MARTIGNPLSWTARILGKSGSHLAASARELGGDETARPPQVQTLSTDDIRAALRAGWQDFMASRSDVMFIVLIYPVVGLLLFGIGLRMEMLPLLFPLISGFALLGPVAAIGLYEISRRREAGESARWLDALRVVESPSFGAVLVLGLYLTALFVVWMLAAAEIYGATLGTAPPDSVSTFMRQVLGTGAGWAMIVIGCGVGAVFALVALAISVVSFPLLLDRHVGLPVAIATSIEVTRKNPRVVLGWGAVVVAGLVIGALPMLLGLIITLPVLGHATWHFYRRAVK
ncbi:DUF2189 domain-containing protein [Aestuariicoccus sp. MJ-SS9]|uniref:DUF2189 domain-containing protein n=1 Tax=Aestuariicoccus sp. MJ-SS9 TaxID=3079855 RepID=UPI002906225B|nr:DUF2189 domain-containing protein [Aestuariicoccus sp. MJ-SS9]MDU8909896.1 DUF2189 domain-containing protein [Aestuariicoccus sp. MJ-SS9]